AVNGRISPSSFKTYHSLRFLFARVLRSYSALAVQSRAEAERYAAIAGAAVQDMPIAITGNLKLDGLEARPENEIEELRASLGISPDDFVIVAGSTHEGEESAVLDAALRLQQSSRRAVKLIIAPRHPERFAR